MVPARVPCSGFWQVSTVNLMAASPSSSQQTPKVMKSLKGIVAGYPSEAEWLMNKLGMKSFGHIFSAEKANDGSVLQDIDKCSNCRICLMVCPKGVFGITDKNKIRVQRRRECFSCKACVSQCPEDALSLG